MRVSIAKEEFNMQGNNFLQKLTKSQQDKWIGGVCGGLGEHTSIPAWCWRFLFSVTFFFWGFGLIFYLLLWIFVPAGEK
jgi:phage shock protein PspC (stress-responsive transcriptional regulator)